MNEFLVETEIIPTVFVGAVLPLALAVIIRLNWSAEAKALFSLGFTVIVGWVVAWAVDIDSLDGTVLTMVAVYVLCQIAYFGLWKPTGVAGQLERVTG